MRFKLGDKTSFTHLKGVFKPRNKIGQQVFQTFKHETICRISSPLVKLIKGRETTNNVH